MEEPDMDRVTVATRLVAMLALGATVAGSARADDFPPRKPGLWQVNMTMAGGQMPPQQMKMCIDSATDAEMYKLGMNAAQGMCTRPDVNRSGNTVTMNSVCKMGQTQATTQAVTKFTGDTAYHTDVNTKFDPPMAGHGDSTMVQEARWTGACPADMQPGDVLMGNGMKVNIKQMLGGKP
jgi:Protein of unknown function (DUF3617)